MFNLGKVYVVLEKTTALIGLGFIAAVCGCFLLKNGFEKLINGGGSSDPYARLKATIVVLLALGLIGLGLFIILGAEHILPLLSQRIKNLLEIPLGTTSIV